MKERERVKWLGIKAKGPVQHPLFLALRWRRWSEGVGKLISRTWFYECERERWVKERVTNGKEEEEEHSPALVHITVTIGLPGRRKGDGGLVLTWLVRGWKEKEGRLGRCSRLSIIARLGLGKKRGGTGWATKKRREELSLGCCWANLLLFILIQCLF